MLNMPVQAQPLLAVVLCLGVCVGCAPPTRLAHDPSTGSLASEARPSDRKTSSRLFADCSGVTLGRGVFELQCPNQAQFYVTRYDATPAPKTCRRMVQRLFSGATVEAGPSIGLPDSSYTYRLTEVANPILADEPGSGGLAACVPHRRGGMGLLLAQPGVGPDSSFAPSALAALAYDGVPADRVLPRQPAEVPLLGRTLKVHSSCELKGAQNLSCYPNGQMNWGTFSTIERARTAQRRQLAASRQSANAVLADTTVRCTFEGVDTRCRRLVYRAPASKLATLGASNVLIVFYAAARVRDTPARAVCSFYRDQARSNGLAPLCQEAFEVPEAAALMRSTPK